MGRNAHIAIDLGAESGRIVVGMFNGRTIDLCECYRFHHRPLPTPAGLCWDLTGIWRDILQGLRAAAAHVHLEQCQPASISVDTWAVDYALVSEAGELLGLPRCYRDPSFIDTFEHVQKRVQLGEIYRRTGIQHLPFNTLYQYAQRSARHPSLYARGSTLLFMPDLIHWLLCGVLATERTLASTSQMVDVRTGGWNTDLLNILGLPTEPLLTPSDPGRHLGPIRREVAAETGLPASTPVVLTATHDTASAIAAVPASPGNDWCYISSGTWSLLGAELTSPCITVASSDANFTNELGVHGSVRFLKNISGLWLVQRLRAELEASGQTLTYEHLTRQAEASEPFRTLIPAGDSVILQASNLHEAIDACATRTGQPTPSTPGGYVRCCLESLALEYRHTLESLERVLDRRFSVLHLVGGGSKNALLNRMTANATGRPVLAGPVEATATGNALVAALSIAGSTSLPELRAIVRDSTEPRATEPGDTGLWEDAFARYRVLPNAAPPEALKRGRSPRTSSPDRAEWSEGDSNP